MALDAPSPSRFWEALPHLSWLGCWFQRRALKNLRLGGREAGPLECHSKVNREERRPCVELEKQYLSPSLLSLSARWPWWSCWEC